MSDQSAGQHADGAPPEDAAARPEHEIPADRGEYRYSLGGPGEVYPRGVYRGEGDRWRRIAPLPYVAAVIIIRDGSGARSGTAYLMSATPDGPRHKITAEQVTDGTWAATLGMPLSAVPRVRQLAGSAITDLAHATAEVRESVARADRGRIAMPPPECLPPGYLATSPDLGEAEALECWRRIAELALPALADLLGAAAFGPYIGPLGQQSHVVDLYSDPGKGKTTVLRVAAALFGNSHGDAGTLRAFNVSGLGLPRLLGDLGVLPAFVDEAGAGSLRPADWSQFIYRVTTGAQRITADRRSPQGFMTSLPWHGVLIMTGNGRITDGLGAGFSAGVIRRVVEVPGPFTSDAGQAEQLVALALAAYGYPGVLLLARFGTADARAALTRVTSPLSPGGEPLAPSASHGDPGKTWAGCLAGHIAGAAMLDDLLGTGPAIADPAWWPGLLAGKAADAAAAWLAEHDHEQAHDADRLLQAVVEAIAAEPSRWPTRAQYRASLEPFEASIPGGPGGSSPIPRHGIARTFAGVRADDYSWVALFGRTFAELRDALGIDEARTLRELYGRGVLQVAASARRRGGWMTPVRLEPKPRPPVNMYRLALSPAEDDGQAEDDDRADGDTLGGRQLAAPASITADDGTSLDRALPGILPTLPTPQVNGIVPRPTLLPTPLPTPSPTPPLTSPVTLSAPPGTLPAEPGGDQADDDAEMLPAGTRPPEAGQPIPAELRPRPQPDPISARPPEAVPGRADPSRWFWANVVHRPCPDCGRPTAVGFDRGDTLTRPARCTACSAEAITAAVRASAADPGGRQLTARAPVAYGRRDAVSILMAHGRKVAMPYGHGGPACYLLDGVQVTAEQLEAAAAAYEVPGAGRPATAVVSTPAAVEMLPEVLPEELPEEPPEEPPEESSEELPEEPSEEPPEEPSGEPPEEPSEELPEEPPGEPPASDGQAAAPAAGHQAGAGPGRARREPGPRPYLVLSDDGRAYGPDGEVLESVSLDGVRHAGDLVILAARLGTVRLWLPRPARKLLGLPAEIPDLPPGEGHPHPFTEAADPSAWGMHPGGPRGLAGWMDLWAEPRPGRALGVGVPEWMRHRTPVLDELTPAELARVLDLVHQATTTRAGRGGVAYERSPAATFKHLLSQAARWSRSGTPEAIKPPPPYTPARRGELRLRPPGGYIAPPVKVRTGYVVARLDVNQCFASAVQGTTFGLGTPEHVKPGRFGDEPGAHLVMVPRVREVSVHPSLTPWIPAKGNRRDAIAWLDSLAVRWLTECGVPLEVLESYIWPDSARVFDSISERLGAAVTRYRAEGTAEHLAAAAVLKAAANQYLGGWLASDFGGARPASDWQYRPDWWARVRTQAETRKQRNLLPAIKSGALIVLAADQIDSVYVAAATAAELKQAPGAGQRLLIRDGRGGFSNKQLAEVTPGLAARLADPRGKPGDRLAAIKAALGNAEG